MARRLISCNVYVSEGRNARVIDQLRSVARAAKRVKLITDFVDAPYHRSSYTLAGQPQDVVSTAFSICQEAIAQLDLRLHNATHPRIGIVDHISFHPLQDVSIEELGEQVSKLGQRIGEELDLPILLYGSAHPEGKQLAAVRRGTSYFKGLQVDTSIDADFGPSQVDASKGVCAVGAVPFVLNYNVPVRSPSVEAAKELAKSVRERNGGLDKVESLALHHDDDGQACESTDDDVVRMEVACNLLDTAVSPPDAVQRRLEQAATALGVQVEKGYIIGFTKQQVIQLAEGELGAVK